MIAALPDKKKHSCLIPMVLKTVVSDNVTVAAKDVMDGQLKWQQTILICLTWSTGLGTERSKSHSSCAI